MADSKRAMHAADQRERESLDWREILPDELYEARTDTWSISYEAYPVDDEEVTDDQ